MTNPYDEAFQKSINDPDAFWGAHQIAMERRALRLRPEGTLPLILPERACLFENAGQTTTPSSKRSSTPPASILLVQVVMNQAE